MGRHSVEQVTYAVREREVAAAAKRLEEADKRQLAAQSRANELGNAAANARQALRVAAGDGDAKALAAARKALRDADENYELSVIELDGVNDRVEQLEQEHAMRRREMCKTGSEIAEQAAYQLEADARDAFAVFATLIQRRHSLALLASTLATEASGRYTEPVRYSDDYCVLGHDGEGGLAAILAAHHLTGSFAPAPALEAAHIGSLLELQLPPTAQAAE